MHVQCQRKLVHSSSFPLTNMFSKEIAGEEKNKKSG
jgi:hypothetical protein